MPPVQGKQALSNLLKLVESEYFPLNYDDALKQLQTSDLSRPTKSLTMVKVQEAFGKRLRDIRR